MDMRTGRTYDTKQAALDAGVPESDIAELAGEMTDKSCPDVRFASGPFKGRVYRQDARGNLVRVDTNSRRYITKNGSDGRPVRRPVRVKAY